VTKRFLKNRPILKKVAQTVPKPKICQNISNKDQF